MRKILINISTVEGHVHVHKTMSCNTLKHMKYQTTQGNIQIFKVNINLVRRLEIHFDSPFRESTSQNLT